MNIDRMNEALKYVHWDKTDFLPSLAHDDSLAAHSAYADWLMNQDDHADRDRGERLAAEIRRQQEAPASVKPVRLGDGYTDQQFVLHAIRTGHPNPLVRVLAGLTDVNQPPHPELIDFLLHADPKVRPVWHDVAVSVAPNDPVRSHSEHARVWRLNTGENRDAGLSAKVVRGKVYLLDGEHPDRKAYGAPGILYEAPVNDKDELDALERHAAKVRRQRAEVGHVV